MEYLRIGSFLSDRARQRWLEGAGFVVSVALFFMYLGLAAGYEKTFDKNFSMPGENLFEVLAVNHLIAGVCFIVLFGVDLFRENVISLICKMLILLLLVVQMRQICYLNLAKWPNWIESYSEMLVLMPYLDAMLAFAMVLLFISYIIGGFRLIEGTTPE